MNDANECFICLESLCCKKNIGIKNLNCCNKQIHNRCLINLFLYNHINCPLCRRPLDIYDYISKKEFSDIISISNHISLFFSPKVTEFYINYTLKNYFVWILSVYIFVLLFVCILIVLI